MPGILPKESSTGHNHRDLLLIRLLIHGKLKWQLKLTVTTTYYHNRNQTFNGWSKKSVADPKRFLILFSMNFVWFHFQWKFATARDRYYAVFLLRFLIFCIIGHKINLFVAFFFLINLLSPQFFFYSKTKFRMMSEMPTERRGTTHKMQIEYQTMWRFELWTLFSYRSFDGWIVIDCAIK